MNFVTTRDGGLLAVAEIVWINILLSGDNAIAIGMACRGLPPRYRRQGILYGTAGAVGLRILFAFIVSFLMALPWLKAVGGLLLAWIAITLARGEDAATQIAAPTRLWRAVVTVIAADATMSLDNVLGIAAIARSNVALFVIGLLISMPLVVVGATAFTRVLDRFPIIVWAGAALLGWVGGGLLSDDGALVPYLPAQEAGRRHVLFSAVTAVLVVVTAALWQRWSRARRHDA
jgi:YjbE family integral membrane protein